MAIQCSDMNQVQIDEFLKAPRFAIVGTNRADGPPQLTPVWYLHQDDRIYLSMYTKSAKYRNLYRDPRIGLCIAGNHPDARSVMIYGAVELVPEGATWVEEIVWRLTRRYYNSDEETRSYLESAADGAGSALVVVTPEKVLAQDYN